MVKEGGWGKGGKGFAVPMSNCFLRSWGLKIFVTFVNFSLIVANKDACVQIARRPPSFTQQKNRDRSVSVSNWTTCAFLSASYGCGERNYDGREWTESVVKTRRTFSDRSKYRPGPTRFEFTRVWAKNPEKGVVVVVVVDMSP